MAPGDVPIGDWLHEGTSDPREVADRYDAWATAYDDDLASWSYRAPVRVAETVLARRSDTRSVLDVGCGTGLVGRALRARGFAGRLLGLDISQASLEVAAQRGGAYDSVACADLQQRLPCADDSVDAVVCVGVMTYLPDVEAVWRELARVAHGLVVVTQRDDLWHTRECQRVVDVLQREGVWTPLETAGPAPYLPEGYGGGDAVDSYYLTALVS